MRLPLATRFGYLLAALLSLPSVLSCQSSLQPRPGEIAPVGKWSVDPALTLLTGSSDEALVRYPDGSLRRVRGLGGNHDEIGGAMPLPSPEVGGRVGFTRWLETGLFLSPLRQSAEFRFGILSQRRRHPLALALAQAVGVQPGFGRSGPWLRTGIDISHRSRVLLIMSNLHVSHGSEAHAFVLGLPLNPETEKTTDAPGEHAQVTQKETRFLSSLALGIEQPEGYFYAGIVPYFVVHASAPSSVSCDGCLPGYQVLEFKEHFGASLVVGGAYRFGW